MYVWTLYNPSKGCLALPLPCVVHNPRWPARRFPAVHSNAGGNSASCFNRELTAWRRLSFRTVGPLHVYNLVYLIYIYMHIYVASSHLFVQ